MARSPRILFKGGIYHVTSRGNERRAIFKDDRDRERFLDRLAESAEIYQVRIYLYCLMSNHIHLLVETPLGNLDRFMGSLLTGYTVYFNRRYKRIGHLMQGRYHAQVVQGDEYLLKLGRYIHLNPVQIKAWKKKGLPERLKELRSYCWSSFREYSGRVKASGWLTTEPMLKMLGRSNFNKVYARYIEAGLAQSDDEFIALMKENPIAIGTSEFIDKIKHQACKSVNKTRRREDVSFRSIQHFHKPAQIKKVVSEVLGPKEELLDKRKAGTYARGFYAWALQQYTDLTQREIADYLGVGSGAAVSMMIKRTAGHNETKKWRRGLHKLLFKG